LLAILLVEASKALDAGDPGVMSPEELLLMPVTRETDMDLVLLLYTVKPFFLLFPLKSVKIL